MHFGRSSGCYCCCWPTGRWSSSCSSQLNVGPIVRNQKFLQSRLFRVLSCTRKAFVGCSTQELRKAVSKWSMLVKIVAQRKA